MKRFFDWLTGKISPEDASSDPTLRNAGAYQKRTGSTARSAGGHTVARTAKPKQALPRRQPDVVNLDPRVEGRIENRGPGKNVLIRNKYLREDTGTHETLKIVDDSIVDTEEQEGFDPYNTGQFDRSRNWDRRRK